MGVLFTGSTQADPAIPEQTKQSPTLAAPLPEVVIRAQREALERDVHAYVSSSIRKSFDTSLARWNQPICPLVVGVAPEEDRMFFRGRLSEIAVEAGARVASQPCRANLVVIVTDKPKEVLSGWYKRNTHIFGGEVGSAVNPFLNTPRPVRVWYNTSSAPSSGVPYAPVTIVPVKPGSALRFDYSADDTHVVYNSVRGFSSVIVTVDSTLTQGLKLTQLSDYAAVVGLAEIRSDPDVGAAPTILGLFSNSLEAKATGLTAWDTAFLKALYHTNQRSKAQRGLITTSIVHDLAP